MICMCLPKIQATVAVIEPVSWISPHYVQENYSPAITVMEAVHIPVVTLLFLLFSYDNVLLISKTIMFT